MRFGRDYLPTLRTLPEDSGCNPNPTEWAIVTSEAIADAAAALGIPLDHCAPMADGGIGLTWRLNGREVHAAVENDCEDDRRAAIACSAPSVETTYTGHGVDVIASTVVAFLRGAR